MIQKAQESDFSRIRAYLNLYYPPHYVKYWMSQQYSSFDSVLLPSQNGPEGFACVKHHAMTLLSERIGYSFVSHFHVNQDRREDEKKMLAEILDDVSYRDLLVLTEAGDNDELFKQAGFVPFVTRRYYELDRTERRLNDASGIADNYTDTELKRTYDSYTSYFDGAMLRDELYFRKRQEYMKMAGWKCIVYRNRSNEAEGYAVFDPSSYPMQIIEIVYLNSLALEKMVSYLLNYKDTVRFHLSQMENISRLWPNADWWDKTTVLAKISDTELFNRLFNTDFSSSEQLMEKIKRPLFHNEVF